MYDIKADFKKGLIPNAITFVGLTMILPIIIFHREGMYLAALAYFIIAWFCDWLDGWVARKYDRKSMVGEFFDPLADKVFTWSMLIYFWDRVPQIAALTIMLFGLLATIGRIIIVAANRYYLPISIDVMAGYAGKLKANFEKSGLITLILADIIYTYLYADNMVESSFNYAVIGKCFEFLSLLGLWLSVPLASISFLSIIIKLRQLRYEI